MSWYPGHMKKSIDEMREKVKLVDMIVEIIDARIPLSTKNPLFDELTDNKAHLLLMSKNDLADPNKTKEFLAYFNNKSKTIDVNMSKRSDINRIFKEINFAKENILKNKKVEDMMLKIMVVGMPNVGKSTFLNAIKGKRSAKVGNTPGITKNLQWVGVDKDYMILDTPGLLMPSRRDERGILNLKLLNSMEASDDPSELAILLIDILKELYPGVLNKRYDIDEDSDKVSILEAIAIRRGAILKGREIDYTRAGEILLQDLRSGKLGRLTLEDIKDI
ncbi:MAG: ribosome biogenesis GTPase YlqF [Firmicutes bacterium]|nr:ribosome biogenesis GTPase YlqF [Bacillota bacterium]